MKGILPIFLEFLKLVYFSYAMCFSSLAFVIGSMLFESGLF